MAFIYVLVERVPATNKQRKIHKVMLVHCSWPFNRYNTWYHLKSSSMITFLLLELVQNYTNLS